MISCETFRASFQVDDRRPEILEHLRRCDACLHFALEVDQDVLFRSIGGDGLVPPGGVDQFAAGVMKQIELRRKSSDMAHHRHPGVLMRWAAAAVIVTGLATSSVVYRRHGVSPVAQQASIRVPAAVTRPADATRSVIESYASDDATIMEVPVTSDNNVKVVMIFDQSLPADL
jgi:anti-sigma factor RsiW